MCAPPCAVWWRGPRGRGREEVEEVAVPDADPLNEEQRGGGWEKRFKSRTKRAKRNHTARGNAEADAPQRPAASGHLCVAPCPSLRPCEGGRPSPEPARPVVLVQTRRAPRRYQVPEKSMSPPINADDQGTDSWPEVINHRRLLDKQPLWILDRCG